MKKKLVIIGIAVAAAVLAAVLIIVFTMRSGYRDISVYSVEGSALVERDDKSSDAYESMKLKSGDVVTVARDSLLRMLLDEDKIASVKQESIVELIADKGKPATEASGSATSGSATSGSATSGSATNGSATNGSATNSSATSGSATSGSATNSSETNGSEANGSASNGSASNAGKKNSGRTSLLLKQGEMTIEVKNKLDSNSTFNVTTGNSCIAIRGTVIMVKSCVENGENVSYNYIYEGNADVYSFYKVDGRNVMVRTKVEAGDGLRISSTPENTVDISTMREFCKNFGEEPIGEAEVYEFDNLDDSIEFVNKELGVRIDKTGLENFETDSEELEKLEGAGGIKKAVYLDNTKSNDAAGETGADGNEDGQSGANTQDSSMDETDTSADGMNETDEQDIIMSEDDPRYGQNLPIGCYWFDDWNEYEAVTGTIYRTSAFFPEEYARFSSEYGDRFEDQLMIQTDEPINGQTLFEVACFGVDLENLKACAGIHATIYGQYSERNDTDWNTSWLNSLGIDPIPVFIVRYAETPNASFESGENGTEGAPDGTGSNGAATELKSINPEYMGVYECFGMRIVVAPAGPDVALYYGFYLDEDDDEQKLMWYDDNRTCDFCICTSRNLWGGEVDNSSHTSDQFYSVTVVNENTVTDFTSLDGVTPYVEVTFSFAGDTLTYYRIIHGGGDNGGDYEETKVLTRTQADPVAAYKSIVSKYKSYYNWDELTTEE